jgi:hypothetical protein
MLDMVLTTCRDEEDIVGTFVQYYLAAGFDRVQVIDNGSRDATAARVQRLAAAGLPVDLVQDPRDGYERYLTEWFQAAGHCWHPRWLLFLDCDEFILFPGSAKTWFDALPRDVNRLCLRQKEIYPTALSAVKPGSFLLSTRAEPRFNDTTKDAVRWHPDARVYAGKHRIELPNPITCTPDDLFIRHYKYRNLQQGYAKERNRVNVQRLYSDKDLSRLSAFSVEQSRAWFSHCETSFATDAWRDSFAPDIPAIDDPAMAKHAAALLPHFIDCR